AAGVGRAERRHRSGIRLPDRVLRARDERMTHEVPEAWPSLPLEAWSDTCATLHRWLQIVGKIRLTQMPWTNHSWHVTLDVTGRGLTTTAIPYGTRTFEIHFDFFGHRVGVGTSDGGIAGFALEPQSVAQFYRRLMEAMATLDLDVKIHTRPNE